MPIRRWYAPMVAVLIVAWTPVGAHAAAHTCSDYPNQAAAQAAGDTVDADGDGIYCEDLPCPCSTAAPGSAPAPPTPAASPPKLLTVGATGFHLVATYQAAGASDATLNISTNPAVGTDGNFLTENIVGAAFLTAPEIASGSFTATDRTEPGHYWAMLRVVTDTCSTTCVQGSSNVVEFTITPPVQNHRGLVTVYRSLRSVTLGLRLTPAGNRSTPYRVCWMTAHHIKRCLSRTVKGLSWFTPATSQVDVRLRDMTRRTTFRWYIDGKVVATRTASTIPS